MLENPQMKPFKILDAINFGDLIAAFDSTMKAINAPPEIDTQETELSFGVRKEYRKDIIKARIAANTKAEEIVKRVKGDPDLLSPQDRIDIAKYSGEGGINSEHEYYTPSYIAEGTWDALKAMGLENGNVLEPSAGTGVFNNSKPKGTIITATEISEISSQVNQLLHPEDKVHNSSFEMLAVDVEDNTYDAVTGNVPFGKTRGGYGEADREYKDVPTPQLYFVLRALDKVKHGGLVALVVPMTIVSLPANDKYRKRLSMKGEFLGAHRMPTGIFSESGAKHVTTDLVIFRKHSEQASKQIADATTETLEKSNVIWDQFIDGKWFAKDGKRFVMGTESNTGNWESLEVINNEIKPEGIKKKLSHRFKSRIDWELLSTSEPAPALYAEGDERKMNDRWYRLVDGDWELIQIADSSGRIDPTTFGVETTDQLTSLLDKDYGLLTLNFKQIKAIENNFAHLISGNARIALDLANSVKADKKERVFRGVMIGQQIQALTSKIDQGVDDLESRLTIQTLVNQEIKERGSLEGEKSLFGLSGVGSGQLNQFLTSKTDSGEFSTLLQGTQKRHDIEQWNNESATQVVTFLFTQMDMHPVTLEDFNQQYTGEDAPLTLKDLSKVAGVAITPEGLLEPFDRYCSGDTNQKVPELQRAIGQAKDGDIRALFQKQLDEIKSKRKVTKLDDISIKMSMGWLDRKYALEFLDEIGYDRLGFHSVSTDEFGDKVVSNDTTALHGKFSGYRFEKDGTKRDKAKESFERQLESYLNGDGVRGKAQNAAVHRTRIKQIEEQFANWIRQHDDIDQIHADYNETYNAIIPFDHSDAPIKLTDVSEDVKHFGYQNAGIRRMSEDGRGILAFGTGLGKTFTALGVAALDTQMGRSRRTCIIVPKAVIENWFHESKQFFGKYHGKRVFVAPIHIELDKDGNSIQEKWLDKDGKQKVNEHTKKLEFRTKIKILEGAPLTKRMNMIPQSAYDIVVMTKQQFGALPMRPETKEKYVDEMVDRKLMGNRMALDTMLGGKSQDIIGLGSKGKATEKVGSYREAQQTNTYKDKYGKETEKKHNFPYYEDMGFDRIIVDEGHEFRNSYAAGRETAKLAYLPTSPQSMSAVDMAIKAAFIKEKHDGRGVMMLTATVCVNSPTDIYNMLSLIMTPKEWERHKVTDVDSFIKIYGKTKEVQYQTLSGDIEPKEGLVGFENLEGLRGIYNRWVNMKDNKDVGKDVAMAEKVEEEVEAELNDEQNRLYDELRDEADSETRQDLEDAGETPRPIFSIIRDMDRISTDMDLYNRTITYHFKIADKKKVDDLIAKLPATITVKDTGGKEDEESVKKAVNVKFEHGAVTHTEHGTYILVIHEVFEDKVTSLFSKFKINESDVTHPLTPKYSKMLSNLKKHYEAGGSQLIFTEEKSQHNKVKRLIAFNLGVDLKLITIINADTTDGKKDKDGNRKSLDTISSAYNAGKYKFCIANKKAEVGVNLHVNTVGIHHLTLPWTPASISQKNGRGIRVGGGQSKVNIYYYVGKGSFDSFRLSTLKRKAKWMDELFRGDKTSVDNGDADSEGENQLLLAKDSVERKRIMAEQSAAYEAEIKKAAAQRASIDLHNFTKAKHVIANTANGKAAYVQALTKKFESLDAEYNETSKYNESERGRLLSRKNSTARKIRQTDKLFLQIDKAEKTIRRLKPKLEKDIKEDLLNSTVEDLDNAQTMLIRNDGHALKLGAMYKVSELQKNQTLKISVVHITELHFDLKQIEVKPLIANGDELKENLTYIFTAEQTNDWEETSYVLDDLSLIRLADKTKHSGFNWDTLKDLGNTVNKDNFSTYIDNITISTWNDLSVLTRQSGELKAISADLVKNRKNWIYPDKNDKRLKEEFAKLSLSLKTDNAHFEISDSFNRKLAVFLLGDNWKQVIESYGSVISETDLLVHIEEMNQDFELSEKLKAYVDNIAAYSDFHFGSLFQKIASETIAVLHKAFDNHDEIDKAFADRENQIEEHYDTLIDAAKEVIRAKQRARKELEAQEAQRERDLAVAAKKDRIAQYENEPPENRVKRLKWLDELVIKFNNESKFAEGVLNTIMFEPATAPYTINFNSTESKDMDEIDLIITDIRLALTGVDEFSATAEYLSNVSTSRDAAIDVGLMDYSRYRRKTLDPALFPKTDEGQFGAITLKKNTTILSLKGQRSGKGGTFEAGQIIGVYDGQGELGKLKKVRKELKKAYDGGILFGKNVSSDFQGAWWLIDASYDLTKLKELLDI